jgi:Asp-tRNA(Asn)/Glu-tRNA(Gln) amidotransferase A subunit family amidase
MLFARRDSFKIELRAVGCGTGVVGFPFGKADDTGTATDRTKFYLERIAAREKHIGAWTCLGAGRAMNEARETDRDGSGSLLGLILGVKDVFDTHDMPTGLGFQPYGGRQPIWDAGCVAACRQAGAVMLGKTVTTEFAYFSAGKTRNPHDLQATPGGSSSGSAAAVADGMVDAAFGSQTAGSLIRPAAYCGVIGYKASHAAFGLSGVRPLAQSFDSLGILSRTLENIQAIRCTLEGRAEGPEPAEPHAPRLGFCRTEHWREMDAAAQAEVERTIAALREGGAEVTEVVTPDSYKSVLDDHGLIMAYEVARNYAFELYKYADTLSEQFKALCRRGLSVSHDAYRAAQQRLERERSDFGEKIAGFDAWISPSALGEAPPATEGTGSPAMCLFWTALGAPGVALPSGFGPNKRPLGIQLVNAQGSDRKLLAAAGWVNQRLHWNSRLLEGGG